MPLIRRRKRSGPTSLDWVQEKEEEIPVISRITQRDINTLCVCKRPQVYTELPSHCPYCGRRNYYAVVTRTKYERAVVDGKKAILASKAYSCRACGNEFFEDTPCRAPVLKDKAASLLEHEAAKRAAQRGYVDDMFSPAALAPENASENATIETVAGHAIAMTDEQKAKARDILGPLIRKYQRGDTQDGDRDN